MSNDSEPVGYGALAGDAYRALVDVAESINAETIGYVRSLMDIFTKPYTPIERAAATAGATLDVLEADNRHAAEFARVLADVVTSAHETYVSSLRKLAETSISNAEFVRDTATRGAAVTLPMPSVN